MSHELETAAGVSLGGFFRRRADHAAPIGTPCANCATPLLGPWCYVCGQLGEDFHRSMTRLAAEGLEGVLHVDGRLWRTLPDLLFRPARLTHAFLEGHRAPQIPPLRLFLVVLLAVFLAGAIGSGRQRPPPPPVKVGSHVKVVVVARDPGLRKMQETEMSAEMDALQSHMRLPAARAAVAWLKARVLSAIEDPERFQLVLEQWSERFAFLTLPLAASLLSLIFVFNRRFYVFDHTIFSLHSLSAVGLMLAFAMALAPLTGGLSEVVLYAVPVHLFVHMRGVYRTSIAGTLFRMLLLFLGSLVGAILILIGLLWVGLSGMGN
jgi:hypothetical protein